MLHIELRIKNERTPLLFTVLMEYCTHTKASYAFKCGSLGQTSQCSIETRIECNCVDNRLCPFAQVSYARICSYPDEDSQYVCVCVFVVDVDRHAMR